MGHTYRTREGRTPPANTTTRDLAGLTGNTTGEPDSEINATAGALEAATELGVDITQLQGTGKDGRITKGDVEAAAESQ